MTNWNKYQAHEKDFKNCTVVIIITHSHCRYCDGGIRIQSKKWFSGFLWNGSSINFPGNQTSVFARPVAWYRATGKGQAFYTSIGHDATAWKQTAFVDMLQNVVIESGKKK